MRKAARFTCILAVIVLLVSTLAMPASAVSTAPYGGFNYDPYGNPTAAPLGYVPNGTLDYKDMGLSTPLLNPEDFTVYTDEEGVQTIWIADTGNNRIVVLDAEYQFVKEYTAFVDEEGNEYKTIAPANVYLKYSEDLEDTEIFVCTGGSDIGENGKPTGECFVLTATPDGKLVKKFGEPTDAIVKLDDFRPHSVVLDDSGYLYVHVSACTEGLVVLDYDDGSFNTYFGANKVVLTWETAVQQTWKKIFSRSASAGMISLTPTEISNIYIDEGGFIYTTTSTIDMDSNLRVRKLNASGNNILSGDANALVEVAFGTREKVTTRTDTRMVDIHVDQDGVMATLDSELGRVYLYDETCTLLTVFGYKTQGSGNTQAGATFLPVAVDKVGTDYVILDSKVGTLVTYRPTYYIEMLLEANSYYLKGWYIEGEKYWREVIRYDANFSRGYAAIGKSLLEQGDYEGALEWLKTGQDRTSYSTAFTQYRRDYLRANYYWFFPLIAAAVVLFVVLIRLIQKWLGVRKNKNKIKFN